MRSDFPARLFFKLTAWFTLADASFLLFLLASLDFLFELSERALQVTLRRQNGGLYERDQRPVSTAAKGGLS